MTKSDWIEYAKEHRQELLCLLADYHPTNRGAGLGRNITAPRAEKACEIFREQIVAQFTGEPATIQFSKAIDSKDFHTISHLLNDTWFGVPESQTDAWNLVGFKEAVFLLEESFGLEEESNANDKGSNDK